MYPVGITRLIVLAGLVCALAVHGENTTFYAINGRVFELRAPGKEARTFVRDETEPMALAGEDGWMGELRENGGALLLSADQRQGLLFVNGFLRKRLVDGRETNVKVERPAIVGNTAIKAFWPPKEKRLKAGTAPADFWAQDTRLRLWFVNPNLAGGLLALGALAALGLLFCRRWSWRIAGVFGSMALLALLVKTESRASLLAFVLGCGLMALTRLQKLFSWKVWLPVTVCAALVCGYVALQRNSSRFTTEMFKEGTSQTSRIPIWTEVPRMIADAPWGWGIGNSGKTYIKWYQKENTCLLENLVSGHCTFLVEQGWPLRIAYVFFWMFMLAVSARAALRGRNPMPLGVFGAFAFLGLFHPCIYAWELWCIPAGILAHAAARHPRWKDSCGPTMFASGCTLITCLTLFAIGIKEARDNGRVPIAGGVDAVTINGSDPDVWIVDDDYSLHGGYWWLTGKEIRDWCAAKSAERNLGYAKSLKPIPRSCKRLVLVGEAGEAFCDNWTAFMGEHPQTQDVVFLSPSFSATSIPDRLSARCKVRVLQGGLVACVAGYQDHPSNLTVISGAGLYVSDWLDLVTAL